MLFLILHAYLSFFYSPIQFYLAVQINFRFMIGQYSKFGGFCSCGYILCGIFKKYLCQNPLNTLYFVSRIINLCTTTCRIELDCKQTQGKKSTLRCASLRGVEFSPHGKRGERGRSARWISSLESVYNWTPRIFVKGSRVNLVSHSASQSSNG